MHKWYVVQVVPTHEKKVKRSIEEQLELKGIGDLIEQVLLPIENVSEMKRGKQIVVEKRLWPGYLLVKMELTDDSWLYVKQTAGVLEFLGGAAPTPLSDREVDEILRDLADKKEKVTQKHKFAVGDHVKIIEGVFVNFVGTVTEVFHDKGRLSVLVSIFGRDTRVDDLEFTQVEEITEEAGAV
ncbi:MAG: transcription termination/antitermination protein NusG [Parachlamydiaceae bacterium]|nr:transcription termination/antitermination protein NusG [Parachlamydiaceae bacterium]